MNIRKIDDRFAATGQVRPDDVAQLAQGRDWVVAETKVLILNLSQDFDFNEAATG